MRATRRSARPSRARTTCATCWPPTTCWSAIRPWTRQPIAVVGSSYGGYLAAVLTSLRPVRWLALRVPAHLPRRELGVPKGELNGDDLTLYRQTAIEPEKNRALAACEDFIGDVLIVESEHDRIVPHPVIENYLGAFKHVRS